MIKGRLSCIQKISIHFILPKQFNERAHMLTHN